MKKPGSAQEYLDGVLRSIQGLPEELEKKARVRGYASRDLGRNFTERAATALTHAAQNPLSQHGWNTLKILLLGSQVEQSPGSEVFYTQREIESMRDEIARYPELYGAGMLAQYAHKYVQSHDNPKDKWGTESIIQSIFSGEVLYAGPITIGDIRLDAKKYLIVGHDKIYNQGRAKAEDHKAVVDALKGASGNGYAGVVFIVDTPGADSGRLANESHQAGIMSELITTVSTLQLPTITLLSGEGGSGGAEVFFGTDLRVGLANSYFSTIHPIGHSAIIKGRYSPEQIVWLLGVDAPHLADKGVIDTITRVSLRRSEVEEMAVRTQFGAMIRDSFGFIAQKTGNDPDNLLFSRGLTLRHKTANMLSSRSDEITGRLKSIEFIASYEKGAVVENFGKKLDGHKDDLGTGIRRFFMEELEASRLTKFNISTAIDTLIQHVGSGAFGKKFGGPEHNNIVGIIRSELYNYQAFFWTLSMLIDPKHYDRFFSTSGTHTKRLVSDGEGGLSYSREDMELFLREIYISTPPGHIHSSYDAWKIQHMGWLDTIMQNSMEDVIEMTKKFKQVHYDMPDTIVALALLLVEKFVESVKNDEYNPTLSGNALLVIDFHTKAVYEQIRYYEGIRKQIFGKCSFDEIERKFLGGGFIEGSHQFEREHTTALQNTQKIDENPSSSVLVGWGRIGYNDESNGETIHRTVNQPFGVVMIDFSIEGGAIDGSAAANIIRIIERAAREERPVIMFLQSAGMYVDGGPEAVSSMTAINFAIAEYHRKTQGNPNCRIFSVPMGVCTGGTIASFAQAPGVIVLPLSLSDIPFAGRIVTLDQLPLEATLSDFQVGKGNIHHVIKNPFISESTASQIYAQLRNRGIAVTEPIHDLIDYLEQYLGSPTSPSKMGVGEELQESPKTNQELFHPYKRVAVLNRGTIAAKAIRSLRSLGKPHVVFTTLADKDLPYVVQASKKGKIMHIGDYMLSEMAIIQAIRDSGCDAVYLGYGFWSERDSFIKLCEKHNIVVIGPNSNNVKQMGDKITARQTFKSVLARVESSEDERIKYSPAKGSDDILGGDGILPDAKKAVEVANKIGYPVMIKAVYGGGGKGIARIENDSEMMQIFDTMSRTAIENFGNGAMYMEKALDNQRHIEVQVFRDIHGNATSLGVRDCTTQRNRQKIIEETGDIGIDVALLSRLQDIAVAVTKNIDYVGAGTFEFLYDPEKGVFTFMEMNTRIQVEHTVTERLLQDLHDKDINLVTAQFEIAEGGTPKFLKGDTPTKIQQALSKKDGHVMEVRICAEDPAKGFAGVSMAKIKKWSLNLPSDLKKKVRFETYLSDRDGINHTSRYDSMIGQLIVSGKDREETRKNMIRALHSLEIDGIPTNIEFALRILESDELRDRELRISSMDSRPPQFFDGLTPYDKPIDSVSELREDSVVVEEGEYVVRMDQDAKITHIPVVGTEFSIGEDISLFEVSLNKVNTVITPAVLMEEGKFYMRDSTGQKVTALSQGRYKIVEERLNIESRSYNRGKALIVIRPI